MKRISLSVVAGLLLPVLIFAGAIFTDVLGYARATDILLYSIIWPLYIYAPIFGESFTTVWVSMLCDFIVYALLSYALLSWRNLAGDKPAFQTLNLKIFDK